jgi:hypothetical protein
MFHVSRGRERGGRGERERERAKERERRCVGGGGGSQIKARWIFFPRKRREWVRGGDWKGF